MNSNSCGLFNRRSLGVFFYFLLVSLVCLYSVDLALRVDVSPVSALFGTLSVFFLMSVGFFKFRRFINPVSLLLPFCLGYFYYQYNLSEHQVQLPTIAKLSFYVFVIFYLLGCFSKVALPIHSESRISHAKFVLLNVIFASGIFVFIAECFLAGGLPLALVMLDSVDAYSNARYIPVLHYLVLLQALFPAIYYYIYCRGRLGRLWLIVLIAISSFILLNTLSRQIMILAATVFFFTYSKSRNLSIDQLAVKWALGAVVLFFLIGEVRIAAIDSSRSATEFLKLYSGVPQSVDANLFDVTFNLYASMNFSTFAEFIGDSTAPMFGLATMKPVITLLGFDSIFGLEYSEELDGFVRLGTILADPYLDFGVPGVAFFAFLYGLFVSSAYRAYTRSQGLGVTIIWAVLVFVMVMAVFTNFFNVLFTWMCLALGWLMATRLRIFS